jgi:glycosyltransferase involved in cell wall biosynthesis
VISVVIPFIDEYAYLEEALTSVLEQQDVDLECIVVCNASEPWDGEGISPGLLQQIVVLHEPRRGSAYARNAGLQLARGEWVQFLDADDLLLPDKLRLQSEQAIGDVVVSPHIFRFLDRKEEVSKWLSEDLWVGLLNSGLGSTSSMLWRRQAIVEAGGWNTAFQSHQEYELLFRLMASGKKIIPLAQRNTIVRQRAQGSITANTRKIRVPEGISLREQMRQYLKDHGLETPERYEAFRQYLFRQLRGLYRQDRLRALQLYAQYFPKRDFVPEAIHVPGYHILYRLLGFRWTEQLICWWIPLRNRDH